MRLKVYIEGYIDLDEEMIEFYNDELQGKKEEKIYDIKDAIMQDIEKHLDYLKIDKIKNISVEEESKI